MQSRNGIPIAAAVLLVIAVFVAYMAGQQSANPTVSAEPSTVPLPIVTAGEVVGRVPVGAKDELLMIRVRMPNDGAFYTCFVMHWQVADGTQRLNEPPFYSAPSCQ